MIIRQFIDAKWYTVPLEGIIERLPDGSKTLPNFEYGWRIKYSKNFNTKEVKLASGLTGKISGIIAIDCDNSVTEDIFKKLDPDHDFEFKSNCLLYTSPSPRDS